MKETIRPTLTIDKDFYEEIRKELVLLSVTGTRPSFNALVVTLLQQWLKEVQDNKETK